MKASLARWVAPGIALLVIALVGPAGAPAQTAPTEGQTAPTETAQAPDSVQAQPADSVQAQPSGEPTSAPPPATTPEAGASGTTTTTPQQAAPSTPPPATAPAAQSSQAPPPAAQASSAPAGRREPFSKGSTRLTLTGGWGRSFDEDYLMLGVGAGRFIANGLNIGLDLEAWMFGDPGVFKISPNVNYVLAGRARRTKPYLGGFWRRTMIEDADDLSSVGGRAGAYFKGAGPVMIGGGAVYENYLDCEEKGYESCSQVYPEFLISASF